MDRQIFIEKFGDQPFFDINLMDEWAEIYTDQVLFWQAQYARFYAKEMFDIAVASESKEAWTLADNIEIFAKLLESSLIVQ
jgi:hypothetical protein